MKHHHIIRAMLGVLFLAGAGSAFAVGTPAGDTVSNTASVDYTVSGVNQTDITSAPVSFVVDRKIDLTVAEVGGGYTDVAPGATGQVLTFTVSNTSNATLDFGLTAADGSDPHGGTDNFNPSPIAVYVESGANANYQPLEDTQTYVDELTASGIATVYVVSSIPLGRADGEIAGVTLTARAKEPGVVGTEGANSAQTGVAETPGSVDTVFADTGRDAQESASDAYRVRTATIAIVKTSRVISDPFNTTTNPKRIPGATVEYCIEVTNSSTTTAASGVVVSDDIDELTTTFVAASGRINSAGCTDDTGGTAGGAYDGNIVTGNLDGVAVSTTERFQFRVTIN